MTASSKSVPAAPGTFLVGCDASDDIRVFSGTTYHLALEGARDGMITSMINLYPRGIGAWRSYARAAWWKLGGGSRGRHGFKFTDGYLDEIWKPHLAALRGSTVINNFQLYGPYFLGRYEKYGIDPYCYIDATLGEYFDDYGDFDMAQVDDAAKRCAFATERAGYSSCRRVFVMSRRSAGYLARHYAVPADRIHVVPPGANIPERLLEDWEQKAQPRRADGRSLVIGFVGLYPKRKGLPKIAEAVRRARCGGYDVRLNVIGKCPAEIARQDGVTYFGLIDKTTAIDRFVEVVAGADLGCMLSRAETAGIALLEFLRLGIPVIAADVGGIPDIVQLGAGELFSPEIPADELAERFVRFIDKPDRLAELRETAWQRRRNASWRRPVRELKAVLQAVAD
jgi:glycosyltransferase involved in cell wall biosynthesis